ncbi:MAG: hypothetical protein JO111_04715 [Caulobacteraceae bacterium]|nr:hypothetical protein [Caulobacteraceae bacterium]
MAKALLPLLIVAGALLAGCGKVGYLEQPAPLWGEKAKAEYKAKTAAGQPSGMTAVAPPPAALEPAEPGSATPVPTAPAAPPSPPVPPVGPR